MDNKTKDKLVTLFICGYLLCFYVCLLFVGMVDEYCWVHIFKCSGIYSIHIVTSGIRICPQEWRAANAGLIKSSEIDCTSVRDLLNPPPSKFLGILTPYQLLGCKDIEIECIHKKWNDTVNLVCHQCPKKWKDRMLKNEGNKKTRASKGRSDWRSLLQPSCQEVHRNNCYI